MKKTQIQVKASFEFKEKLENAAKELDLSISDYIRIAVVEKIKRDK